MSKEEMVKEAVEEAKAKAAQEAAESEESEEEIEIEDGDAELSKEEAADAEESETEEKDAGKGLFGKRKKKDKKDEKIEELTDRLTRQMAEFDNFRKRTDREKSQMYEVGAKDVIEKILPVVDNFERGLEAAAGEEENPFMKGMEQIYKQLMTTLEGIGVKPIEAVGKEFDPDFHNAVMHVEDEEVGENIITEEFQKGYMYRESVVRHSMVKVAN
jgi:molecular chaperone GrpE